MKAFGFFRSASRWMFLSIFLVALADRPLFGQMDQGTITGTVQDDTGAVVPNAQVTLTSVDTGLVLETRTDKSGMYTFSPVKIGNYSVSAVASGFAKTTQANLHLDIQQRLAANLTLKPGVIAETVVVTGEPALLQTEDASVSQVFDTKELNDLPIPGRNITYIAQLSAGATPGHNVTVGSTSGDFDSNGGRVNHNTFILDGVNNNVNLVDYLNGSTFNISPVPDLMLTLIVAPEA